MEIRLFDHALELGASRNVSFHRISWHSCNGCMVARRHIVQLHSSNFHQNRLSTVFNNVYRQYFRIYFTEIVNLNSYTNLYIVACWPGGGGVLLEKLGRGVRPASAIFPTLFMTNICDFPYPTSRPDQKFDTLFMTWPLNDGKMAKIDTLFMTKTA